MEKQRIEEQAKNYAIDIKGFVLERQESFIAGAEWAIQETQPKWIKVKDKLPDFDDRDERTAIIYVCTLNGETGEAYAYKQRTHHVFWAWKNTMPISNVTHWIPLPNPPQEQ